MTTIYRDDITGEEYRSDTNLYESGIVIEGMLVSKFDTVEADDLEHVENAANRLHEMVDEWADDRKEFIAEEGSE
jgi:hypothetical protein